MSTAEHIPPLRTVAEFLAWEEQQGERYEFVDGVIRMMTGSTQRHAWLMGRLVRALEDRLPRRCMALAEGLKLVVQQNALYPDVLVTCDEGDMQRTATDDAILVAEVLSPNTPKRDLDRKEQLYLSLPGLRHYLVVSQDALRVAVYTPLAGGGARLDVVTAAADTVVLGGLEIAIPMTEIYHRSGLLPEEEA